MVRIIDGKKYDTETAESVSCWNNGMHYDVKYESEILYRTKKGNWFIQGSGGALSSYSRRDGNALLGTTEIIAITDELAKKWLEMRHEVEVIEKYFGEIEEA